MFVEPQGSWTRKWGDVGIDADAAVAAHQQLTAEVGRALAVLAPNASEKVSDFAMQAALFAVGAPVFISPPNMELAGWIASMPDESLDGLRNSMVETARAMGDLEAAARMAVEPKEAFASAVAGAVPNAASGIIADTDAVASIVDESEPTWTRRARPPECGLRRLQELGWGTFEKWRHVKLDW